MTESYRHRDVPVEIQAANVAYFQRKIKLSGFSAYPDSSPTQFIRISGVILYYDFSYNWVNIRSEIHYDVITLTIHKGQWKYTIHSKLSSL